MPECSRTDVGIVGIEDRTYLQYSYCSNAYRETLRVPVLYVQ